MEDIKQKYTRLRPEIKDGDVILFHGTGLIAKIIQNCDKSYFNHVGLVFEKLGALYIIDANENGVQADRLSHRINKYKDGDFMVVQSLKSKDEIEASLKTALTRSSEKTILYDFYNGGKELLNRKFGWDLKIELDESKDICSDFVLEHQLKLEMIEIPYSDKIKMFFPEDTIRYKTDRIKILN